MSYRLTGDKESIRVEYSYAGSDYNMNEPVSFTSTIPECSVEFDGRNLTMDLSMFKMADGLYKDDLVVWMKLTESSPSTDGYGLQAQSQELWQKEVEFGYDATANCIFVGTDTITGEGLESLLNQVTVQSMEAAPDEFKELVQRLKADVVNLKNLDTRFCKLAVDRFNSYKEKDIPTSSRLNHYIEPVRNEMKGQGYEMDDEQLENMVHQLATAINRTKWTLEADEGQRMALLPRVVRQVAEQEGWAKVGDVQGEAGSIIDLVDDTASDLAALKLN